MAFSTYLKNLRAANNLTQKEMAGILNVSVNAVKLIENGSTKYPGKKVLTKLCEYKNQDALDVVYEILFCDEGVDINSSRYLACRYLAYMYLEGWNIDKSPYISPGRTLKIHEFDGKISRKGKLKDVVIVSTFERHLYRIKKIESEEDVLPYIGDVVSFLMSILEYYKDAHLLFDSRNDEQVRVYKLFVAERLSRADFGLYVALFNPDDGEVIDTTNIILQ